MRVPRLAVGMIQPLIHWNTGAVGRSCLGFSSELHLIRPLGFSLDDSAVKRAGLDYWKDVDLHVHDSWTQFSESALLSFPQRIVFSKSEKLGSINFFDFDFSPEQDTILLFGSEKYGVPPEIADTFPSIGIDCVYYPMTEKIRSFNVANTASMALAEYKRQQHVYFRNNQLEFPEKLH